MSHLKNCSKCLATYSPEEINGIRVLKVFKGYTIDIRLQQFRKVPLDDLSEFIEFDSEEGQALQEEMHLAVVN